MRKNPFTRGYAPAVLPRKAMGKAIAAAVTALTASGAAHAVQFDIGNPDSQLSWDNTVKYSAAARVRSQNGSVADNSIGPQANTNDGDLNFGKGLISNRLDVLSELEYRYKREFGARISGAAWYDDVYNRRNDNPGALGGALVNSTSANYDQFTKDTARLHGRKIELMDAFGYANFAPGETSVNVKAGRFTQGAL